MNNIPTLDWELSMRLAGNRLETAKELLSLLLTSLPCEIKEIKKIYELKDYIHLRKKIHKLHGSLCYCGVPRLKNIVVQVEAALKKNIIERLPILMTKLENEANLLLSVYQQIENSA